MHPYFIQAYTPDGSYYAWHVDATDAHSALAGVYFGNGRVLFRVWTYTGAFTVPNFYADIPPYITAV